MKKIVDQRIWKRPLKVPPQPPPEFGVGDKRTDAPESIKIVGEPQQGPGLFRAPQVARYVACRPFGTGEFRRLGFHQDQHVVTNVIFQMIES